MVVDQFGSFGRLTVEVARSEGLDVAHMPPGKFGQVAATYGEGKSDAKDAFVIADTARSQPRHIIPLPERGEALAARCQSWLDDARARLAAVAGNGSEPAESAGPDANSTPF